MFTMDDRDARAARMLWERRRELGLTQLEVAVELGMSIHQYQRYENGQHRLSNCPMRIGLRICLVLEFDPYDLIHIDGAFCD